MNALTAVLFSIGYPVSIAVIARWIPVVRERRNSWFVAHTIAVMAIVLGWALQQAWRSVAINTGWLLVSLLWYARGWAGPRPGR